MLLVIDDILSAEELAQMRAVYAQASFGDGRVTAGELAAKVKNNMQLDANSSDTRLLTRITHDAFHRNALFVSAALPKVVCPPLFNRYTTGMNFGLHTDNAIRICAVTLRTDISGTLFLSEPGDYNGGELVIQDTHGAQRIKLAAGSLVLYPSGSLHQVESVIRGRRDVAVFWVQSMVRDASQRALLLQLDASIQGLRARLPGSPEIQTLVSCYHNLLRMWADI
jgi:PKHD-type hydroxylase